MRPTRTLQEAIDAGYVVRRDNYKVSSQYFKWCSKHDKPYVVVVLRQKWASVELDLIGVSYRLNTLGINVAWQLLDTMTPATVKKWWQCSAGGTICHSNKIPIERTGELAAALASVGDNLDYRIPYYPGPDTVDYDVVGEAEKIAAGMLEAGKDGVECQAQR